METRQKLRYFFGAIMLIAFFIFLFIGFDKINNYSNSDLFYSSNTNAYVGGDAYNYIINGTYFTGYMVLAIGFLISSVILFATARFQPYKERPININSQKEPVSNETSV